VLAIIIAIAIAVPIYLWVATLTAPKETKVGKGNMVIEDISWGYDNNVTLVIKNTGAISLLITDIYVKQGAVTLVHFTWDGSSWTSSSTDYTLRNSSGNQLTTQLTIGVGESVTIIISFNNGWDSGYAYTFKIVSSSGAVAERTEIAP
ncbi:hypothetical protein DRO02_06625, partial [archaeon]